MGDQETSRARVRSSIVAAVLALDRATGPDRGATKDMAPPPWAPSPTLAVDGGTAEPGPCYVCGTSTHSYAPEWGTMICSDKCGEVVAWDACLAQRAEEMYDMREREYGEY